MSEPNITRRDFVGTAAATGVASALAGSALATSCAKAAEDSANADNDFFAKPAVPSADQIIAEKTCDVLVIGAGTAGNPAARAAAETGAKVIAIDKGADLGYVPASQDFGVIGSKVQEELGIEWASKTDVVKQLMKDMCYRPNPRLLNYWYDHSGAAFDWCIEGVDFQVLKSSIDEPTQETFIRPKMFPALDGYDWHEEYYPYFHGTIMTLPSSAWVMQNCVDKAQAAGAEFIYGLYADQLITDEDGAVVGAYAHDVDGAYTKFTAKAVILSCGDFAGSPEMMERYVPHAAQFSVFYSRTDSEGNKANTGDGHRMAIHAGAAMELGPYAPMAHHMGGPLGVDAFLQLNSQGERFMNEDVPGQNLQDQLSRQPGGFSWQILDDKWRDELEVQGTGHGYVNHWLSEDEAAKMPWVMQSVFLGYITDEAFFNGIPEANISPIDLQADSIEELARLMELPVDTVVAQVERYNELCAKGVDEDFGKDAKRMFALDTPPYYATKFDQASMLVCCGGIKCDLDLHALDEDDGIVPGLFVAGNTMGGRFAVEYPVTVAGISLGTAITFGRLAGENAAKEALAK